MFTVCGQQFFLFAAPMSAVCTWESWGLWIPDTSGRLWEQVCGEVGMKSGSEVLFSQLKGGRICTL